MRPSGQQVNIKGLLHLGICPAPVMLTLCMFPSAWYGLHVLHIDFCTPSSFLLVTLCVLMSACYCLHVTICRRWPVAVCRSPSTHTARQPFNLCFCMSLFACHPQPFSLHERFCMPLHFSYSLVPCACEIQRALEQLVCMHMMSKIHTPHRPLMQ